jgi:hypothetical protein
VDRAVAAVEEPDVATDVVGMMAGAVDQRGADPTADLARALTTLQLGIELLAATPQPRRPVVDRRSLIHMLIAASEQVGIAAGVLFLGTEPVSRH